LLDAAPRLRLVCESGTGMNNIDVDACTQRGIPVRNVAAYSTATVAQTTFMHILSLLGDAPHFDQAVKSGAYSRSKILTEVFTPFVEAAGKTLGIIGMGRIGQALARRAQAAGMRIIYHNRHRLPDEIEQKYNATYVDFQHVLQDSDYLSLNLPYTPEVHHLIGKPELGMMKRTAYLINTARGAHVHEEALVEALKSGIIAGAALDVYEHEPAISTDLLTLPNVVLSPHTGTGTWEGRIAMCENVCDNILAFIEGQTNKMNIVL
jgi:lactate dehydrogenase-like 2-hydroxyacid dehydrogenase